MYGGGYFRGIAACDGC